MTDWLWRITVASLLFAILGAIPGVSSAVQTTDKMPSRGESSIQSVTPSPITQADSVDSSSPWFHVQPEAAAVWKITRDPQDVWTLAPRDPSGASEAAKHVLVLYTKPSSAYDTAISTILSVFHAKRQPVSFTVVNFWGELKRGQRLLTWAITERFDLIFSMGSDATAFLSAQFNRGPIPVVSVSSKDPVLLGQMHDYVHGSGTNIAYTSLNMPVEVQMTYLKALRPQLQNIAVLYAASNQSAIQTQVEPLRRIAVAAGVHIIDVAVANDKQARAELAAKIPEAIAEIAKTDPAYANSLFWITGSTSVFDEIETINEHGGMVPVLSAVPDVVRAGDASALLSIGISFESNAHLAAVYGIDVLTGSVRAGDLKVGTVSPPDIAINFRRARVVGLKIPFSFFESASVVYDQTGRLVRKQGEVVHGP